jgi:hypothetical protein
MNITEEHLKAFRKAVYKIKNPKPGYKRSPDNFLDEHGLSRDTFYRISSGRLKVVTGNVVEIFRALGILEVLK